MRWLGIALLLAACNQSDTFHAPNPGNLNKPPYDFAAEKYPRDLNFDEDMSGSANDDLGNDDFGSEADSSSSHDLRNTVGDHDLSGP